MAQFEGYISLGLATVYHLGIAISYEERYAQLDFDYPPVRHDFLYKTLERARARDSTDSPLSPFFNDNDPGLARLWAWTLAVPLLAVCLVRGGWSGAGRLITGLRVMALVSDRPCGQSVSFSWCGRLRLGVCRFRGVAFGVGVVFFVLGVADVVLETRALAPAAIVLVFLALLCFEAAAGISSSAFRLTPALFSASDLPFFSSGRRTRRRAHHKHK